MSKSSATRKRRVKKAHRMCRAICAANGLAGCVMDEADKTLCGPSNCDVYRAMVRGEVYKPSAPKHSSATVSQEKL